MLSLTQKKKIYFPLFSFLVSLACFDDTESALQIKYTYPDCFYTFYIYTSLDFKFYN